MMEIAIAIVVAAVCAWDIGRRHLAGERKTERAAALALAADVAKLRAEHDEHAQTVLRHERALTDLRGTKVAEKRTAYLTGVNR